MRILVTGAGGFVGGALVPHLIGEGHEVLAASTNASILPGATGIQVRSVGPETDWSNALTGVDCVVHLAARAHVLKEAAGDPLAEHRKVNTEGTRKLAQQAAALGVSRFIFISSTGVLGNNSLNSKNGYSFTEADDPNPHDDYSRSKWEAEQALETIGGIDKVVIRPCLIYGQGVPGNMRRLINFARRSKPFPLGAVKNKRSLLGVGNLCSFISLVLTHPSAHGQTYVLADEEVCSTAELYSLICKGLGVKQKLISVPEAALRAMLSAIGKRKLAERLCDTLVVDASKARKHLGWMQPVTQAQGLKETVQDTMCSM